MSWLLLAFRREAYGFVLEESTLLRTRNLRTLPIPSQQDELKDRIEGQEQEGRGTIFLKEQERFIVKMVLVSNAIHPREMQKMSSVTTVFSIIPI
ncbi:hypothetical protein P4O66_011859, partial [Electrophorus voltai]